MKKNLSEYDLQAWVETISPAEASQYLAFNHHHREVNQDKVDKFAKKIRKGKWKMNGKTIVLDAEGKLVNGQHRLKAVVLTGIPITTIVVKGIEYIPDKE